MSPQLQTSGETDTDFNDRGQFLTSFRKQKLQVIGVISSLDMQIQFELEMTEMERPSQQE